MLQLSIINNNLCINEGMKVENNTLSVLFVPSLLQLLARGQATSADLPLRMDAKLKSLYRRIGYLSTGAYRINSKI